MEGLEVIQSLVFITLWFHALGWIHTGIFEAGLTQCHCHICHKVAVSVAWPKLLGALSLEL